MSSVSATDTVLAARADARARGALTANYMPYLPASSSPFVPGEVDKSALTWAETVAPGGYSHRVVARGSRIRFDDPTGEACAHVAIFNALEPSERLNVADTQKIPWQAYLGETHPLLSGDGRVLATMTRDTSGSHDAFCGTSTDAWNKKKFGASASESPAPSGRSLFTLAAAKHGLGQRDLPPSVSFFQGVRVGPDGDVLFTGSAGPGTFVVLTAELPIIVLVANVPHPSDPRESYTVGPLRIHAWRSTPTGPGDAAYDASPERTRAYLNTIDYAEAGGL